MPKEDIMNRSMDTINRPDRGALSDHMHSTYNTSFLGIAPPTNAYLEVMQAKFEREQKRQ